MQDKERLSRARSNLKEQESYSFETVIYRKQRQSAVSSNYQTGMRILNEMFQNKKIFLEIREVGEMKKCLTAGLAGQVMVCGQDCDLAALQRILAGTQVSTVLKSGSEYPELFVNACIDYYLGELTAEDFDSSEKNCDGKEIPFMSYDSKVITIDNVDDAIEAGLYTYEEIYQK